MLDPSQSSLRTMSQRCTLLPWVLLALLGLGATQKDESCCGPIVPRKEWRAQASECTESLSQPLRYVVVSHTAGSPCDTPVLCRQQAQNVQHYHKQTLGFCDVGYNFLIGEDGLVYEGRGWATEGAHSGKGWNHRSIGITFMGNYMGFLHRNYEVKGHRQVQQTLSPGDQLYEIIQLWPRFRE